MHKWICLISLSVFLFSQNSLAKVFLTYNQYYALSPQKQSEYINSVKQLAFSLEKNPYLAVDAKITSSLYVYFLEELIHPAEASALSAICDVPSATHLNDEDLLSKIEQMMNCSEKLPGGPNHFIQVVPKSAEVLSNEYKRRLESGALNRRSRRVQEANGIFSGVVSDIRKGVIVGGGNFSQQEQTISNNIQATESLFRQAPPPPSRPAKIERPVQSQRLANEVTHAVVSTPPTQIVKNDSSLLCIYAGFVISKNDQPRCQAMSRLPKSFESGFFDTESFVCSGRESVLCNPLLFGYESVCEKDEIQPCYNKKPLCILRSASATKNCQELAKSKNALPHVEDVWKSPTGEALYNDYINSLESLCDTKSIAARKLSKRAKNDIIQTCKVAFEVFQDHVDRKFLPRGPKDTEAQGQR